ncbi:centromere protein j [Anaeramoeba flamelloides]|uniref:Centromere protein j n=1 Tax=Anaeramoeba flamelloides TaxID=1746091 RepID=A0AAV7Z0G9_9EUKA|nr:centromere protein j [Anaeramoeba flamelloides]
MEERRNKLEEELDQRIEKRNKLEEELKDLKEKRNKLEEELLEMRKELKELNKKSSLKIKILNTVEKLQEQLEDKNPNQTKQEIENIQLKIYLLNSIEEQNQQIDKQNEQTKEQNQQIKEQNQQIDKQNEQVKEQNQQIEKANQFFQTLNIAVHGKLNNMALFHSKTTREDFHKLKTIVEQYLESTQQHLKNKQTFMEEDLINQFNETNLKSINSKFNEDSIPFVNRKEETKAIINGIISDFLEVEDQTLGKKITNLTWFGSSGIGKTRLAKSIFFQPKFKKKFKQTLRMEYQNEEDSENKKQANNLNECYDNFLKYHLFFYINFQEHILKNWETKNIEQSLLYRILMALSKFNNDPNFTDYQVLLKLSNSIQSVDPLFVNLQQAIFSKQKQIKKHKQKQKVMMKKGNYKEKKNKIQKNSRKRKKPQNPTSIGTKKLKIKKNTEKQSFKIEEHKKRRRKNRRIKHLKIPAIELLEKEEKIPATELIEIEKEKIEIEIEIETETEREIKIEKKNQIQIEKKKQIEIEIEKEKEKEKEKKNKAKIHKNKKKKWLMIIIIFDETNKTLQKNSNYLGDLYQTILSQKKLLIKQKIFLFPVFCGTQSKNSLEKIGSISERYPKQITIHLMKIENYVQILEKLIKKKNLKFEELPQGIQFLLVNIEGIPRLFQYFLISILEYYFLKRKFTMFCQSSSSSSSSSNNNNNNNNNIKKNLINQFLEAKESKKKKQTKK